MTPKELKSYFPITRLSIVCGFPFFIVGMIWQFIIYNPTVQGSSWVYRHFLWETYAYDKASREEYAKKHGRQPNSEEDLDIFEELNDEDDNKDE